MGIPGSGKSTWAARHADGVVLSADSMRLGADAAQVIASVRSRAVRLLTAGRSVTVDTCSTLQFRRLDWLQVAYQEGALARLVVFEVPLRIAQQRNAARPRGERVPWPVLQKYGRRWPAALAQAMAEPWGEVVYASRLVSVAQ